MRGQRLFVRPIDPADHDAIRSFLELESTPGAVPSCGLIGKLVGNLVAVLGMELIEGGIRIDHLLVARDFRRKRIGRFMLQEVENLARKMERRQVVAYPPREAREFFLRSGYEQKEEDQMVRILIDA